MAKATIKQELTVSLTLNEEEALFLKSYLQNWLGHGNENPNDKAHRQELFQEIQNALAAASQRFR